MANKFRIVNKSIKFLWQTTQHSFEKSRQWGALLSFKIINSNADLDNLQEKKYKTVSILPAFSQMAKCMLILLTHSITYYHNSITHGTEKDTGLSIHWLNITYL